METLSLTLILPFLLNLLGIAGYIRFATHRGIIDVPNLRSSHTEITPRGGGVFFSLGLVAYSIWEPSLRVLAACSFPVAAAGFIDDVRNLGARVRLGIHLLCAVGILAWASHFASPPENAWFVLLGGFVIVYSTNAFNFIDGIDGLLASMSAAGAIWMSLLFWNLGFGEARFYLIMVPLLFAFLIFNWSPAKIFMGDVGSGFLGFSFAAVALLGDHGLRPLCYFGIVFAPLLADTAVTLVTRLLTRQNIFRAHRSHAYQIMVGGGKSHASVALIYAGYILLFSGPLGFFSSQTEKSPVWFALAAYLPMIVAAIALKAGINKISSPIY